MACLLHGYIFDSINRIRVTQSQQWPRWVLVVVPPPSREAIFPMHLPLRLFSRMYYALWLLFSLQQCTMSLCAVAFVLPCHLPPLGCWMSQAVGTQSRAYQHPITITCHSTTTISTTLPPILTAALAPVTAHLDLHKHQTCHFYVTLFYLNYFCDTKPNQQPPKCFANNFFLCFSLGLPLNWTFVLNIFGTILNQTSAPPSV